MPRRKPSRQWPPKGAYPLPGGGYAQDSRSKNDVHLRFHLREEPDLERLARVIIELAKRRVRRDKRRRS